MNRAVRTNPDVLTEEQVASLICVGTKLGAIRHPAELIRSLAQELRSIFVFDYLSLYLEGVLGEGPSWHVLDVESQSVLMPAIETPFDGVIGSWVLEHQVPYSIPAAEGGPCFPEFEDEAARHGVASMVAVPLTTVRRRLGRLSVASRSTGAYGEAERRFLSHFGNLVALAIDDAANFERLRVAQVELARSNEGLRLILDVGRRLLSNLDMDALFRSIASTVRASLRFEAAAIILVDKEVKHGRVFVLDFPESRGVTREGTSILIAGTAFEEILRSGVPHDLRSLPPDDPALRSLRAEELTGGYGFPLVGRDGVLGVLGVATRGEDGFDAHRLELLEQIAGQVGTALDNTLAYREIAELKDKLAGEKLYLEDEIKSELRFGEIVGRSEALRHVLSRVETVAATGSTVLITGETGTGKELIARAIHDLSGRQSGTFVKLSCAAIPTGLLESELFGHQKGAFTGAIADRVGRFELANGGTIFLDEIGEVPLETQPKLLRVLQEREFERIGTSKTRRTDARLIAATNRDLAAMVQERTFRADLYYRLNVFPIHVPPLRERPTDIPLLVRHFVQQLERRLNKKVETIPSKTLAALTRYDWPGNIRELQNVIERAMILTRGPALQVPLGDLDLRETPAAAPQGVTREMAERTHLLATLAQTDWVLAGANGAASRLGMKRTTLQYRMKKLGIVRPERRHPAE
jgi:formate hydrogenlyase transcriptional activator